MDDADAMDVAIIKLGETVVTSTFDLIAYSACFVFVLSIIF